MLGSKEDNMIREDFEKEYEEIAKETGGKVRIFETGGHPAIYSNAEKAAEEVRRFLLEDD